MGKNSHEIRYWHFTCSGDGITVFRCTALVSLRCETRWNQKEWGIRLGISRIGLGMVFTEKKPAG